ncbi:MAG: hypothetical protein AVDCRST_MAG95-427 [uncultured Adhaeribacter sp.]|uniref:Uncharacterized protein n=1 Tax=uncultured Adhaeribacter sp. TaxID=448109 RepID=A0A6J4H9B1_9BACT|nr:MAG: hypothetical protein AVDCRST_MAG95-427 [uncultured Adhaeribacter sp.]
MPLGRQASSGRSGGLLFLFSPALEMAAPPENQQALAVRTAIFPIASAFRAVTGIYLLP